MWEEDEGEDEEIREIITPPPGPTAFYDPSTISKILESLKRNKGKISYIIVNVIIVM